METKNILLSVAIGVLQKTVASNNEESTKAIAQRWIDTFKALDPKSSVNYDKPDDENRLWFMLEEQKENILSQLALAEKTQSEPETETPAQEDVSETTETVTEPEPTPEVVTPAPVAPAVPAAKMNIPAPKISFSVLFAKTQEQAAIFNQNLCAAVEAAFNESQANNLSAFENVLSQIMTQIVITEQNHKQELIALEERLNRKLESIFRTTCVAANGVETMAPMYAALEQKNNHSPKF